MRVVVLDYGSGNLRSAERALARVGADVTVTDDAARGDRRRRAGRPGVGAFAACMAGLDRVGGADDRRATRLAAGAPVLGICVGMQVLFDAGVEHGVETAGLGVLPGRVEALHAPVLPHMGWNTVAAPAGSTLFAGLDPSTRFYFVHSYAVHATRAASSSADHQPRRGLRRRGRVRLGQRDPVPPGEVRRRRRHRPRELAEHAVMIVSSCCPPSTSPTARRCASSRARPAPRRPTATRWRRRWPGSATAPSGSIWSISTPRSGAATTGRCWPRSSASSTSRSSCPAASATTPRSRRRWRPGRPG